MICGLSGAERAGAHQGASPTAGRQECVRCATAEVRIRFNTLRRCQSHGVFHCQLAIVLNVDLSTYGIGLVSTIALTGPYCCSRKEALLTVRLHQRTITIPLPQQCTMRPHQCTNAGPPVDKLLLHLVRQPGHFVSVEPRN